ncbi:MAG: sulfite exporter TauE/SafE family protein [Pseudonocardiales bacterium]|nr:sulfite exporter TauE/SafE family protein [Pseudonocardiales bacterium]
MLDWPMPTAIGTSLLVIVINAAASLWVRAATSTFGWKVIIPVSLTAIVGALLGKSASDSVSHTFLARAFAVLLVAVAIYTATTSMVALR